MEVCLGDMRGKPVMLKLENGIAYLNGEAQPIKNLTEKELSEYQKELDGLTVSSDPGYEALVNAVRAAFIARLLGKAVGDECVDMLSHILDHVHYEVLKYLGDTEEDAAGARQGAQAKLSSI